MTLTATVQRELTAGDVMSSPAVVLRHVGAEAVGGRRPGVPTRLPDAKAALVALESLPVRRPQGRPPPGQRQVEALAAGQPLSPAQFRQAPLDQLFEFSLDPVRQFPDSPAILGADERELAQAGRQVPVLSAKRADAERLDVVGRPGLLDGLPRLA